jgi:hypothetical protein
LISSTVMPRYVTLLLPEVVERRSLSDSEPGRKAVD